MYLCGPRKHSCGPEGRFYCSDSVCSLWPAQFSYLCVRGRILCVLKIVCGWASKTWLLPYACCGLHFIDSAACVLFFDHSTPLHKQYFCFKVSFMDHPKYLKIFVWITHVSCKKEIPLGRQLRWTFWNILQLSSKFLFFMLCIYTDIL